jgi:hypothetical protein
VPDQDKEIEVEGQQYLIGLMTPMVAFHVQRRMGAALVATLTAHSRDGTDAVLAPMVEAWGRLSDEDTEYIINNCLRAVKRQSGGAWAPAWVNARPMFEDIDRKVMMRLVNEVLGERIGPFFPEPAPKA